MTDSHQPDTRAGLFPFRKLFPKNFPRSSRTTTIVAVIEFVVGGLMFYQAVWGTPYQNDALKQIDVEMRCNQRWADLFTRRIEIEKLLNGETCNALGQRDKKMCEQYIAEYYRQYWALQNDQFSYYTEGFLQEVYFGWMWQRVQDFKDESELGGVTFTKGWTKYGKESSEFSNDFNSFVEYLIQKAEVLRFKQDNARVDDNEIKKMKNDIKKELQKYQRGLIAFFTKHLN